MLNLHIRAEKLPTPEREFRFHPKRMWRFDFAWPGKRIAVEVEGGVYSGGRHTRGKGFVADTTKYNAAALLGWRVFRFPTDMVRNGTAIKTLKEAFA
jgi:very-short-patch-repair endonuclease